MSPRDRTACPAAGVRFDYEAGIARVGVNGNLGNGRFQPASRFAIPQLAAFISGFVLGRWFRRR